MTATRPCSQCVDEPDQRRGARLTVKQPVEGVAQGMGRRAGRDGARFNNQLPDIMLIIGVIQGESRLSSPTQAIQEPRARHGIASYFWDEQLRCDQRTCHTNPVPRRTSNGESAAVGLHSKGVRV